MALCWYFAGPWVTGFLLLVGVAWWLLWRRLGIIELLNDAESKK